MDPKAVDMTDEFTVEEADIGTSALDTETDPHRLAQRQKQIDFGKNTIGYQRYRQMVPKEKRRRDHPRTPDVNQKCSKRAFDGQVRKWRRKLHDWDIYPKESNSPRDEPVPKDLQVSGEEGASPKNVLSQRQGTGLPLTLTGLRPAERTKRSNSATFMEILLSPTNLPPQKMPRKKGQELPSNALMAKWRELEKENIPVNSIDAEIDTAMASYIEEVSYSDHEDHEMELTTV